MSIANGISPPDVILLALIGQGASIKHFKVHILNFILRNIYSLDAEPPKEHPSSDVLNDAVRGAFALTIPSLQHACRGEGDKWLGILTAMSMSVNQEILFNLRAGLGCVKLYNYQPTCSKNACKPWEVEKHD